MRHLIRRLSLVVLAVMPLTLLAQDGLLNTSFDTTGKVYTPFASGSHDEAHAVAIQSDGRIIAAGKSEGNFAVARYWSNGLIDSTFGTNGKQTTNMYGGDGAKAILIQSDKKIILVGTGYVGDFTVARYDTSGALDLSFAGGYDMESVGGNPTYAYGAALQPDGKIVVAGYVNNGGNDDIVVMRFTTGGSLDASFGNSGIVQTNFGGNEESYGVALQADGKIVVVGSNYNNGFLVVRYKSNGVIDSTFGTNGKVLTTVGTGYSNAYCVGIQADKKIVVAGYATYTYSEFAVVRYDTAGVIDSTFNSNGKDTTWFGHGNDIAYGLSIQQDGKIVVAGTITNSSSEYDFGILRYNSNGSLDNTFGTLGSTTTDLGSALDYGNAVAMTSTGNIVVAGQSLVPTGRYSFALAEYHGSSGPLPVEMVSFFAAAQQRMVELTWTTATETNSYGFDVERSTSGSQPAAGSEWTRIGFVPAAGTSNSLHRYTFTDRGLSGGSYWYRLKQIDKNGSFKYSMVTTVEVGAVPKELTLGQNYPNPFNPTTTLEFTVEHAGRAVVKIYDVLGRYVAMLFDEKAEAGRIYEVRFDAARLSSGVYVSVLESGGKRLSRKMVLMK